MSPSTALPQSATPAPRAFLAPFLVLSGLLLANPGHGQAGPAPGANSAAPPSARNDAEPVNPGTVSCSALKARLASTGELRILSGPRGGWPDTFYGPRAPRCEFWQMPTFQYVRANDGLCGIGYICVDKLSRD
jgi:hypothetical protein